MMITHQESWLVVCSFNAILVKWKMKRCWQRKIESSSVDI